MKPCIEPRCQLTSNHGDRCYYHDKVARGLFKGRRKRRTRRMSLDSDQQAVLEVLSDDAVAVGASR